MSDLWILAGQSNMEGCGKLHDVEPPAPNVRCFAHGDSWETAQEPLHWIIDAVDDVHHTGLTGPALAEASAEVHCTRNWGAGLGLPFARAVSERTGVDIDLLPTAHGGTSMSQWSPQLKHHKGGSLYGAMLRRTRLALETGGDTRLRGLLWYQGESDTDATAHPLYLERMVKFIEEVRLDLDAPKLPFILVQLGCWNAELATDDPQSIGWDTVREAQRALPDIVSHCEVVPAVDLELDDGIHIGTRGLKRLGRRLANAAINTVYGREAPTGPKLKSVTQEKVAMESNCIRVSYENVSRMLIAPDPAGRVPGYSLAVGSGRHSHQAIHKSYIDPENPADVLLFTEAPLTPDVKVYYGAGTFPFCQLADSADMAAPAFGPVSLSRNMHE